MRLLICCCCLLLPLPVLAQTTDEPGIDGAPARAPASAPVAGVEPGVLEQTRRECRAGAPCPHFPELVGLLFTGEHGVAAARLLVRLGDPRAVEPMAISAVYGPLPNRTTILEAMRELLTRPSTRPAARRMARNDPDPAIRGVVTRALGGAAELQSPPPEESPAPPSGLTDPDTTRVVYGPTAFGRRKGVWNWTIYDIAYWNFDYGVTDYLEVGMQTVPPIGIVGFMPHLKLTTRLGDKAALGLRVFGGVIYPYIENDDHFRAGIYGGGPILTIGSPDLLLNIAVNVNGLTGASEDEDWTSTGFGTERTTKTTHTTLWAVTPNIGFGWRLSHRVKLNAELFIPLVEDNPAGNGKLWILLYGVRIFGEHIYGDIDFVIPFWPDMANVMKYIPIGFPLLSFGFQWGAT